MEGNSVVDRSSGISYKIGALRELSTRSLPPLLAVLTEKYPNFTLVNAYAIEAGYCSLKPRQSFPDSPGFCHQIFSHHNIWDGSGCHRVPNQLWCEVLSCADCIRDICYRQQQVLKVTS